MEYIIQFFNRAWFRRILILGLLVLVLYLTRDLLNLFLFTFILTYLMYRVQTFLIQSLNRFVKVKKKLMAIFLYLLLASVLIFVIYRYVPRMVFQIRDIINHAVDFYNHDFDGKFAMRVKKSLEGMDIAGYANEGVSILIHYATNILHFIIAIILSLFFLLEKNKIKHFTHRFKESRIAPIYDELEYFGKKFINSFGKVIEAQVMIALTNAILSVICLFILGFEKYVFGLALMIFLLGLIPVAGVFISLFPLCIIAYSIGSPKLVLYVLIMVACLHALEAYFLNPKFMSHKTKMPVFYTLMILLISERIIGVWGLIIGIPIFMFIMDILEVDPEKDQPEANVDED